MAICSFFLLTLAVAQNSTPRLKLPPPKKDTDTRPTLRTLKEKPSVFTGILHNIERVDCPFGRLISRARKECIDAMARLKVVRGKKPAISIYVAILQYISIKLRCAALPLRYHSAESLLRAQNIFQ
eukprot:GEMP01067538.1.p2 GENE.GEMP01067538.1~~GEMP01067538.1.p2  ORF type:complete len:126 (+),score=17.10 GEMP01067538.1:194-571(+)